MNHRLLERQLEVLEESVESGRRLRHDIRHHNAVIAEYARRGQTEELLQFLKEYDRDTDRDVSETIYANTAVNNILAAYTRRARSEQIKVRLDVEIGKSLAIPTIDLVTIIANAYENAIYACMEVKKHGDERDCLIHFIIKKKQTGHVLQQYLYGGRGIKGRAAENGIYGRYRRFQHYQNRGKIRWRV